MTRITATDLGRQTSDLLNRAQYQREAFEVERGGVVVAVLRPAEEGGGSLLELWERLRGAGVATAVDADFARAVAEMRGDDGGTRDPWQG